MSTARERLRQIPAHAETNARSRTTGYASAVQALAGAETPLGEADTQLPLPTRLADAGPPEPPSFLVPTLILRGEPTVLAATGGALKTTTALAIAGAVAAGVSAFDALEAGPAARVLIVSEEDDLSVIQNRLEALVVGHGWDAKTVSENVFVLALEGARLDDVAWAAHIREQCRASGIGLVVFDPLVDLMQGNENNPSEARMVTALWRVLSRDGVSVLICHHVSKPSEGARKIDRLRGASSWANAARGVFWLERGHGGVTLECLKMSRTRPRANLELVLTVEEEEGAPGVWRSARLHAPGEGTGWAIEDRRTLKPSERAALEALANFPDEQLSWSRWAEVATISAAALATARRRLIELGYVRAIDTGRKHAGRPQVLNQITGEGIAQVVS